ncbi:very-long-chain enoyl- reductase-like protein [Labeo rohita]|uniref:Trans-2,3-enoyl-CoA reductase-like n=1 Tax=Labeo rohita TaxID=84645 RepID=A0A498M478_LABRO|nr:very-long-chain enoyl- reductase-like protein [Labeo rohita]
MTLIFQVEILDSKTKEQLCFLDKVEPHSSVGDIKSLFHKSYPKWYPARQALRLDPTWLAYYINHPLYTPPSYGDTQVNYALIIFVVGAWVGLSIMTQCVPVAVFTFVGFIQMTIWAKGKHKTYIREFKDYPNLRMSILPFIL